MFVRGENDPIFLLLFALEKKNRRTHAGSLICDERDRETSSDLPFCFMNRSRKIYFLSFPGALSPIPTYACSPDRLPSSGSRPRLRDSPLPSGQFLFQPRSGKLTVGLSFADIRNSLPSRSALRGAGSGKADRTRAENGQ